MTNTPRKNVDKSALEAVFKERCSAWLSQVDFMGYPAGLEEYIDVVLSAIALNEGDAGYRREVIEQAASVIDLTAKDLFSGEEYASEQLKYRQAYHNEMFFKNLSLALLERKNGNTDSPVNEELQTRKNDLRAKFKEALPGLAS